MRDNKCRDGWVRDLSARSSLKTRVGENSPGVGGRLFLVLLDARFDGLSVILCV